MAKVLVVYHTLKELLGNFFLQQYAVVPSPEGSLGLGEGSREVFSLSA